MKEEELVKYKLMRDALWELGRADDYDNFKSQLNNIFGFAEARGRMGVLKEMEDELKKLPDIRAGADYHHPIGDFLWIIAELRNIEPLTKKEHCEECQIVAKGDDNESKDNQGI